jgi:CheY-specific phosphatase CheX
MGQASLTLIDGATVNSLSTWAEHMVGELCNWSSATFGFVVTKLRVRGMILDFLG